MESNNKKRNRTPNRNENNKVIQCPLEIIK